MVAMETVNNKYLGGDTSLTCSAATQQQIDKRVVEFVKRQHDLAKKLLEEHRDKLDELATYLYEKETITGQEFMDILKREEKPVEPPAAGGGDADTAQTEAELSQRENVKSDTGLSKEN